MKTERITLQSVLDNKKQLEYICDLVKSEEIFVYPTDTIYGIGGRADSVNVKNRIFQAKSRFSGNPMILLASDLKCFESYDIKFPKVAVKIAKAFWPGLLTLVLPCGEDSHGIGVRITDHPFVKALNSILNMPFFSTSANVSTEKYDPNPDIIYETFFGRVRFMIDAGLLALSEPSTVVKVSEDNEVTILRDGVVGERIWREFVDKYKT